VKYSPVVGYPLELVPQSGRGWGANKRWGQNTLNGCKKKPVSQRALIILFKLMFIIKNPPLDPAEAGQDPAIAGQVLQGLEHMRVLGWEHMRVFPPLYEVERGIKGVSTFY
jgi:hypothetical protein